MNAYSLFFDGGGRLRSGIRLAVFLVLFILLSFLGGALIIGGLQMLSITLVPGTQLYFGIGSGIALFAAIAAGWLCGWRLESLPFRALGASLTQGWLRHLLFGLLIGAAAVSFAAAIAAVFGGLSFSFNTEQAASEIARAVLVSFIVFAIAAAWEEAFFRGYILQTFARSGLAWFAIAATAAFFGFVHLGNPDAGYISTANTALAGIWFGIAYLKSRDLWLAWGLHLAWNWMQGSIFGIEVSGLTDLTQGAVLRESDSGPVWLTGGTYGLEGGIACTIALIAAIAAVHFLPVADPSDEMKALTGPRSHALDLEGNIDRTG